MPMIGTTFSGLLFGDTIFIELFQNVFRRWHLTMDIESRKSTFLEFPVYALLFIIQPTKGKPFILLKKNSKSKLISNFKLFKIPLDMKEIHLVHVTKKITVTGPKSIVWLSGYNGDFLKGAI